MTTVNLKTSLTTAREEDEEIQTWVARMGEAEGVGNTKADALRSLADDLDRRYEAAQRGDL